MPSRKYQFPTPGTAADRHLERKIDLPETQSKAASDADLVDFGARARAIMPSKGCIMARWTAIFVQCQTVLSELWMS
jgi:hypothetical protein